MLGLRAKQAKLENFIKNTIPLTGFVFGTSLLTFFIINGDVTSGPAGIVYFAAMFTSFVLIEIKSKERLKTLFVITLTFIIGLTYAFCYVRGIYRRGEELTDGKYHEMTVLIESSVMSKKRYSVCDVSVRTADGDNVPVGLKLRLYWNDASVYDIKVGDTVKGMFRIEKIENVGCSNNKIILNARGIYFQATHCGAIQVLEKPVPITSIPGRISELTEDFYNRVFRGDIAAFYIALMRGNKDYLTEKVNVDIQNIGAAHLLAISGANVSIITSALMFILGRRKGFYAAVPATIFIMLFSGAAPSVMRAGFMNIIVASARFFGKKNYSYPALGASAWLIFLKNPSAVCDIGCILSFAATIGIMFGVRKFKLRPRLTHGKFYFMGLFEKIFIDISVTSVSAVMATLPICYFCFGKMSVLSMLTDILISPLMTVLFASSFVIGAFGICGARLFTLSIAAEKCISYILACVEEISRIPFMSTEVSYMGIAFAVLAAYLIFAFYMTGKEKARAVHTVFTAIAVLLVAVTGSTMEMSFFTSVKVFNLNSVCLYVRNGRQSVLINSGSRNDEYAIWSIYNHLSVINAVDEHTLVLTRIDYKHAGAAVGLIETGLFSDVIIECETKDVEDITIYYEILSAARKNGANVYLNAAQIKSGNIKIENITADGNKLSVINTGGYNIVMAYECGENMVNNYAQSADIVIDMLLTDLKTAESQTINRLKATQKIEFVMIPDYVRNGEDYEPSTEAVLMQTGDILTNIKNRNGF